MGSEPDARKAPGRKSLNDHIAYLAFDGLNVESVTGDPGNSYGVELRGFAVRGCDIKKFFCCIITVGVI